MPNIIRECTVPHHGACDATLSTTTVQATIEAHGFAVQVADDGTVEAWEPATVFPLNGDPAYDASRWVPVPADVHALAAWLGY